MAIKLAAHDVAVADTAENVLIADADYSFGYSIVNRSALVRKVRLGLSMSDNAFEDAFYLEYDAVLKPGKPLVATGHIIDNTRRLVIQADGLGVNIIFEGVGG